MQTRNNREDPLITILADEAEDTEEARRLPPRSVIHSSEKGKWTLRYYQMLVWLFIFLLIGLFIWGDRYTSNSL